MTLRRPRSRNRFFRRLYIAVIISYFVLGLIVTVPAFATGNVETAKNPLAPDPGTTFNVPTGSDDASVLAYYDYMNLRQLNMVHETYFMDWENFGITYGLIAVFIILFFFLSFAWYARKEGSDLYPIEVYNGYITERGGPVDSFNWATYTILGIYMGYYAVVQCLYGQLY